MTLLHHLEAENASLRDEVQEVELRSDWFVNKNLELEMDRDDWRKEIPRYKEKVRKAEDYKIELRKHLEAVREQLGEERMRAFHNLTHLINAMKKAECERDRAERVLVAWGRADERRVRELEELQQLLPEGSRKRPHVEDFEFPGTSLDLTAVPPTGFPVPEETHEVILARELMARLHKMPAVSGVESSSRLTSTECPSPTTLLFSPAQSQA